MVSLVSLYKPPFSHSRSFLTYSRLCFIHQRAGVRVCWKPGAKKKKTGATHFVEICSGSGLLRKRCQLTCIREHT